MAQDLTSVRALFFDLDDTLIPRTAVFARFMREFLARHPSAFRAEHAEENLRDLIAQDRRGTLGRREYARWICERFPALELTAAEVQRELEKHFPAFFDPDARLLEMLRRYARAYRLGLIANGTRTVQRAKLQHTGLAQVLPGVFLSGEQGIAKPDPRFFQRALEWAGVEAAGALHVGDDPEDDIAGAAAAGLRTCWVSGPTPRPYPDRFPGPDFIIAEVLELPSLLPLPSDKPKGE